jgi:hypothetical protein
MYSSSLDLMLSLLKSVEDYPHKIALARIVP